MANKDFTINQIKLRKSRTPKKVRRRRPPRPPVQLFPSAMERAYFRFLNDFLLQVKSQTRVLLVPRLQQFIEEAKALVLDDEESTKRLDGFVEDIANIIGLISTTTGGDVSPGQIDEATTRLGIDTAVFNRKQIDKIMRAVVGVDIFRSEPWLAEEIKGFADVNAGLITKLKDETISDISRITQEGVRQGRRIEAVQKDLEKRFKISRNRAKLIARDQVAKLNASITEKRQTALGIKTYTWRTSNDERVRATHKATNGKLMRWDNRNVYSKDNGKTWINRTSSMVKLHPGEDFQCRCYAEADIEPLLDEVNDQLDMEGVG